MHVFVFTVLNCLIQKRFVWQALVWLPAGTLLIETQCMSAAMWCQTRTPIPSTAHIFAALQVMSLFMRPGKKSGLRATWAWLHWAAGWGLLAAALFNNWEGLVLLQPLSNWYFIGYAALLAVIAGCARRHVKTTNSTMTRKHSSCRSATSVPRLRFFTAERLLSIRIRDAPVYDRLSAALLTALT